MQLVADLHIHSHFSRATSGNLTFEHLARWAQLKGVHVVGTGDISHPGWLAEMRDKLVPAEAGLFRLADDLAAAVERDVPPACRAPVRFILGGEISSIYKRADRTRKVHNVVFVPSLDVLERLQARLERIGNIRADGRPILGLDSRDLLEIILDLDPACHLIPAHIWTPWFSLLGSKSGFDSVAECFADLTPHIFALETGLSSDPPMNWRISALDRYALVSNSDAHSPEKLAREATLFDCELAYGALFDALKLAALPSPARGRGTGDETYRGTIEFFPEEGKYHFDGHRACNVVWDPPTTRAHGGLCPVCGKEVTVGVMHRVEALADRPEGSRPPRPHPFHSLVPLPEMLGEVYGVGDSSKQVQAEHARLLARLGPELTILRDVPLEEIAKAGGERLAEGIGRMRRGQVMAQPGYDGEYGVIRVFGGTGVTETQMGLFGEEAEARGQRAEGRGQRSEVRSQRSEGSPANGGRGSGQRSEVEAEEAASHDRTAKQPLVSEEPASYAAATDEPAIPNPQYPISLLAGLNPEQRAAALRTDRPLVIVAGPGTGKTRTLTVRIASLILEKGVAPEAVLAITFTNKAAGEMRERLTMLLDLPRPSRSSKTSKVSLADRITIKTFHAFGAMLLREHAARVGLSPAFAILSDEDRAALLRQACPELKPAEVDAALAQISAARSKQLGSQDQEKVRSDDFSRPDGGATTEVVTTARSRDWGDVCRRYQAALRAGDAVDFDDLIALPVRLLEEHPNVRADVQARYRWISVDEYQDIDAAQYRLLRLLTGGGANLCVIGDPDQAIYGFRGADPRYFLRFEQDYPGAVRLSLSKNYRSSQAILDAAMQVIARRGEETSPADLPADGGRGGGIPPLQALADFAEQVKLDVYRAPTDRAEAEYVVHQIEQMVGGTSYFSLDSARVTGETPAAARAFADFAVLYRLSAQSRLLIEAFDRSGIPYQMVGQTSLYECKAVREVLAHLWRVYNPRAPQFVGQVANLSYPAGQPVARLIEQIVERLAEGRRKPPGDADAERLRQLVLRSVPFDDRLGDFLEMTSLQSETDAYDPRADRVALMTLHAAKGLEFPVVFIVGCEEGLLPYERKGEAVDIEEERRLFYVGLTRARQKVILTRATRRVLFGQLLENPESRFVGDIESALKEIQEMRYRPPEKKEESKQLSLF